MPQTPISVGGTTGQNRADSIIEKACDYARAQVGKEYSEIKDGGVGPDYFDCSGLCMMAYASAGVKIPRTTWEQLAGIKTKVAPVQKLWLPGDLIYAQPSPSDQHVVMYLGNGNIVQAPHTGATVFIAPFSTAFGYNVIGVRRPVPGGSAAAGTPTTTSGAPKATEDSFLSSAGGDISKFLSASFWERIGLGAAGLALIIFGVLTLTKKTSVLPTIVQGVK